MQLGVVPACVGCSVHCRHARRRLGAVHGMLRCCVVQLPLTHQAVLCAHPTPVLQTDVNLPFITADASGAKHLQMTLTR